MDARKQDIRCPKCRWRPLSSSRWVCSKQIGGCGEVWNTFDTRGICPKCSWQWQITMCLQCKQWSPHPDWYDDHPPGADTTEDDRIDAPRADTVSTN